MAVTAMDGAQTGKFIVSLIRCRRLGHIGPVQAASVQLAAGFHA
jgi:hypothetical protein